MKICVYGASSNAIDPRYLAAGEELGVLMAQRGHSLVFGAGASGMMGAAARGIDRSGGTLIGISPSFFNVDGILYDRCTEMIYTDTMRQRKELMEQRADAFIMTPGGIGTFEEFFEILTLKQLGRLPKPIAILNTMGYFDPMIAMLRHCAEGRFMQEACLDLFAVCATPEEALRYVESSRGEAPAVEKLKYLEEEV